jgi:hypothetical protein
VDAFSPDFTSWRDMGSGGESAVLSRGNAAREACPWRTRNVEPRREFSSGEQTCAPLSLLLLTISEGESERAFGSSSRLSRVMQSTAGHAPGRGGGKCIAVCRGKARLGPAWEKGEKGGGARGIPLSQMPLAKPTVTTRDGAPLILHLSGHAGRECSDRRFYP